MNEYIDIKGQKTAYCISGLEGDSAPVALILQGWGTGYTLYDSIAKLIGDRFKVVQFDMPGFGLSDEPDTPWDVERYADFVCDLLAELNIKSAMLIGHSYGGRVIIRLASRDHLPFEISRIILIDSAGILPVRTRAQLRRQKKYKILKKLFDNKFIYFLFPEIIDDWKSKQGSADYRSASPTMRVTMVKAVNEDLTELLPKITQDTLLIWGDQDTATPIRDAHIMEEKIPNSGLAIIPGTGHFSYAENPELFANIINAYLIKEI
ncbi:MAG: alpha/beta hydrolase [Lachnospiraceae bacterium]|nr:alpha/beta hydrolase [Lachnospiraceae bacterium]